MAESPDTADAARAAAAIARAAEARAAGDARAGAAHADEAWTIAARCGRDDLRARAGHLRCHFHLRLGRLAEVVDEAPEVLLLLEAQGLAAEHRETLRALALGACEIGRFDLAIRAADELCAAAGDDPAQLLTATNALAAAFERMGDPWQAERVLADALARHGAQCGDYENLVTLNNLSAMAIGVYYLLCNGVDDGEARAAAARSRDYARRARDLLPKWSDPAAVVFVEGNLGEALLHLGELDEAEVLLQGSLRRARDGGYEAQVWRIGCSVAELALARGRPEEARTDLLGLVASLTPQAPIATVIRARHGLYRACRDLGQHAEALSHFEECERLERRRSTSQLRAQSRLFVTRVEAEQARHEAQLQRARAAAAAQEAERDPLTGLGNRRHLERRFDELLAAARGRSLPLAVAMLDVDRFKEINDRHGHAVGDQVLVALGQMLRENTRAGDVIVRLGGEEFVIVFPETAIEHAAEVCERLRERVARHAWSALSPGLGTTLSIGLVAARGETAAMLLARADAALYDAKRQGRNRLCLG